MEVNLSSWGMTVARANNAGRLKGISQERDHFWGSLESGQNWDILLGSPK